MNVLKSMTLFGFLMMMLVSHDIGAQNPHLIDNDQLEKELWSVVETKFYSWRDNDLETYMKTYHPDWRRWSMSSGKLMVLEDVAKFWKWAKENEEILEMKLDLVGIDIWCDGKMAVVHFSSTEKFKWIGEPSEQGKMPGDIYEGTLRWSDIYVKEDGAWLCVGGHRDLAGLKDGLKKLN